jgi:hypothetical protein
MATLASIFALEENWSAAVKAVLVAYESTVTVFAPAADGLTGQPDELTVPCVQVGIDIGGNSEFTTPDTNRYYGEWSATITCRVLTDRVQANGMDHKTLRSRVRAAMHTSTASQWSAQLSDYDVAKIEELATGYSVDAENKLDFTELKFETLFRVKRASWP